MLQVKRSPFINSSISAQLSFIVEVITKSGHEPILLVIDDVWNTADLQPFCQGGKRCARLITTRDDSVLPPDAQHVQVDAMSQDEAIHLLSQGIIRDTSRIDETKMLRILAARLGEWALLLKLVNGILRERINKYHVPLPDALAYANRALDQRGLIAFDQKKIRELGIRQRMRRSVRVSIC